jgi:hypothetical protein
MALIRKPFAEFAAELAVGIRAGRADEPIADEGLAASISGRARAATVDA